MRSLIILFIGLFFTSNTFADCGSGGLWVYPKGPVIKQNSIFILEGYELSQEIIPKLNKKYDIYLKSNNKKVKLIVKEIHNGQFSLTQALLIPETTLEPGLEYEMVIDKLPGSESLKRYNNTTRKYEPITYKVTAEMDMEAPIMISRPKEIGKAYMAFGCGPAMYVNFDFPVKDNSDIITKATVKNLKSGIETTYYLMPEKNKISIGHGMCSGAFRFDGDSNEYEVEFSFMDTSGNLTVWKGERIQFTRPTEKDQEYLKNKN